MDESRILPPPQRRRQPMMFAFPMPVTIFED
jgi:hypothetical protein